MADVGIPRWRFLVAIARLGALYGRTAAIRVVTPPGRCGDSARVEIGICSFDRYIECSAMAPYPAYGRWIECRRCRSGRQLGQLIVRRISAAQFQRRGRVKVRAADNTPRLDQMARLGLSRNIKAYARGRGCVCGAVVRTLRMAHNRCLPGNKNAGALRPARPTTGDHPPRRVGT